MPKKRPSNQEMAASFMVTPLALPWDKTRIITPENDLLYHDTEHAFYLYNSTRGLWEMVWDGDRNTGHTARLLSTFINMAYPEVSITNQTLTELKDEIIRTVGHRYNEELDGLSHYTAFTDCLFDWRTFLVTPHDPAKVAFHGYDFPFPQDFAATPVFDAYLLKSFPDDEEMRTFIPEMLGYYLIPHVKEPAAFYVYGVARAGKSVLLDLARLLIGPSFVCSFSLQSLTTDRFTLAELAGKRVNVQDEDESEYILPDKLKALVSQAPMQAERKYGSPFTFRPRCKFLFGSNQLPNFKSVDEGLKRRLNFIEFKHQLKKEEQDKQLIEKLKSELPGILRRAMLAAQNFLDRNEEFNMPAATIVTADAFMIESEPVWSFFHDRYQITAPDHKPSVNPTLGWTKTSDLYDEYREWCSDNGKHSKSKPRFVKALDGIPGLRIERSGDGQRWRSCEKQAFADAPFTPKPVQVATPF